MGIELAFAACYRHQRGKSARKPSNIIGCTLDDKQRTHLTEFFHQSVNRGQQRRERSILSVGGRGYFENPTTDILAFYIDPSEIHELGNLVLESLFDCLPGMADRVMELQETPEREYVTRAQNRIDLVLNGADWVLALENKVLHDAVNPFDEYRNSIEADKRFANKLKHYIILAPYRVTKAGWHWISYSQLLDRIQSKLGDRISHVNLHKSKWTFFLSEWILHIREQANTPMTDDDFSFVQTNYRSVVTSVRLHEEYLQRVREEISRVSHERLGSPPASVAKNNWGTYGIAFSVFPIACSNRKVTLLVTPDGRFRIQVYVDHEMRRAGVEREHFSGEGHFKYWSDESNGTLWQFMTVQDEETFPGALDRLKEALGLLMEHLHPSKK